MLNAKPVPNFTFKNELVYYKRHVVELHTAERWLKYRREVIPDEHPTKIVKGMYNDPQRPAELYGSWQTRPYKQTLTSTGQIPRNKYGNIELFNGPLPEETQWLNLPKIFTVCKKLNAEYVPAVWGFEKGAGGFSHPLVKGAVVMRKDVGKIFKECARI
jgi:hypothetical protein